MELTPSWTSSYVLGNDTSGDGGDEGWGQRYFYTYFTERGNRPITARVECGILLIIFMLSVVANLSIAGAVLRYKEMRTVTNCFLLNLAVADLLFAAGTPLVALARLTPVWQFGSVTCRLLPYSQFVCGFVLLWTLTLISMDRHRCLAIPPYRSELTPRRALLLTAATWLIAAILFLPVAAWFRYYPDTRVCTLVFPPNDHVNLSLFFVVPVTCLSCLLPMSLLAFHYQRIFHKLVKTRSRWMVGGQCAEPREQRKISIQQIVNGGAGVRAGSLTHHEESRLNKHIRVARIILLNVLVVLIMWLPITVVMFLIYVDGSRPTADTNFFLRSHHFLWALLIALLNTVVNPLLYGFLSENFRAYLARMWLGAKHGPRDDCASRAASIGNKTQLSMGDLLSTRQSMHSLNLVCGRVA
ncbi:neuropeptide Y receptor type 2 [Nilaparvata lugens]|uniref:neuropeptide Y receptor type 2 n=1 Tax=Nilaparvata lugens TaxID=108931 RepID=UPI00193D360B|nr:neuropeptide Y receptor type 2 [Nilaparvata lugens]